jgi:uncharacterized membrane protein
VGLHPIRHINPGVGGEKLRLNSRDIALTAIFAALYTVLVLLLSSLSFGLAQVRIADALIPMSVIFGWPAVMGVTLGCLIGNVVSPMPSIITDMSLGALANFLASVLAWKIAGGKRKKITVNFPAIIGAALALISFFFPWWFFKARVLELSVLDFNVYPGWFGGNVGIFINALSSVAEGIGLEAFNQVLNSLKFTAYLVGFGAFIVLIGAFIQSKSGKVMVALGSILNISGVFNFYYTWHHLLTSNGMPVAGSRSVTWGIELANASWGWTYGIYLAVLACVVLVMATVIPPTVLEANDFLGCSAATIAITFIVGTYLAIITGMELWIWWLGIFTGSLISINIVGYLLVQVVKKAGLKAT